LLPTPFLRAQMNDQSLPLFDRYQAMFSLRNNGGKAAVLALATAFADPSPLFRHEVAYVLGQLQVRARACDDVATDRTALSVIRRLR
jgi:HEAT repeat protein